MKTLVGSTESTVGQLHEDELEEDDEELELDEELDEDELDDELEDEELELELDELELEELEDELDDDDELDELDEDDELDELDEELEELDDELRDDEELDEVELLEELLTPDELLDESELLDDIRTLHHLDATPSRAKMLIRTRKRCNGGTFRSTDGLSRVVVLPSASRQFGKVSFRFRKLITRNHPSRFTSVIHMTHFDRRSLDFMNVKKTAPVNAPNRHRFLLTTSMSMPHR